MKPNEIREDIDTEPNEPNSGVQIPWAPPQLHNPAHAGHADAGNVGAGSVDYDFGADDAPDDV